MVLLEGFVPDMEALVAVSPPPSRRDASTPWLCQSRAAMGQRWCWASAREPWFAPGLCFSFLPDPQCMSVKHLNHL